MTEYLRITVIGSARKADVALPNDYAIEELLPEIAALLDEPSSGSPLTLTTLLGASLRPHDTLDEQDVENGAVLRLTAADSAPQAPDVAEVTEAVGDATSSRRDRWNRRASVGTLAVAIAVISFAAANATPFAAPTLAYGLLAIYTISVAAGLLLARRRHLDGAVGAYALSLGVSLALAPRIADVLAPDLTSSLFLDVSTAWGLVWVATGAIFGMGRRRPGLMWGALVALVSVGVVWGATALGFGAVPVVGFGGIVTAAAVGLVPALALATSGLSAFDDSAVEGEGVRRDDVDAAVTEGFATQTALVIALAGPLAASIVTLAAGTGWQLLLSASLAVFALVRARLFPVIVARASLLTAAALPAVGWFWLDNRVSADGKLAIAVAVLVLLLLAATTRATATTHARIRRLLSILELFAIIAMVPALLGTLGVFDDLLGAFA